MKRKQISESLKESLSSEILNKEIIIKHIQQALDHMLEGCMIIDKNWTYLYVNDEAAKHGQQKPKNLIGKTMLEIYPGVEKTSIFESYRRCMEERKPQRFCSSFTFADGKTNWYSFSVEPIPEGIFVFSLDITDSVNAENELKHHRDHLNRLVNERTKELEEKNAILSVEIEERKKAEVELIRLASFPENNPNPIIEIDFSGDFHYLNSKAKKLFPDINKSGFNHMYLKGIETIIKELRNGGKNPVVREVKIDNKYYLQTVFYVQDYQRIRIYGADITERKKIEDVLQKKNEELEQFFTVALDLLCIADTDGNFIKLNKAWENILGYSVEDLEKKKFLDFVHPDDMQATLNAISKLASQNPILNFINRYKCKDGTYRYIEWRSYPKGKLIYAAARDITERKQMEDMLKESEEKYRRIVENTTNVIMVTQPDGIISYLSPSCKEVLGYLPEELVGTNPMIFHPDDIKKVQQALSRALKGEKGSNFEYRIITKNGKIKWISHSWSPIFAKKKLQSVVSVIEDITQRKKIENSIQELNENLTYQTIELSAANKELEAFSYSVSHDLRAPLRSIDGFSQAIVEDYADKLDEQGKDYIQRVRNATQKMGQLIDDMLRLSRLSRAELHTEQIDLSSLAKMALNKLQTTEPSRKVKAIIQDKTLVKADKKLLEILLDNLIGNAWKFTGNNKHPAIEFGSTKKENEIVYFVRDNGAGFDMAYADKLFIPFQRLHSVDEFPGTGIGLAIVSRIVHRHGGRIWAEGEVGKGATFYFTLQKGAK